MAWPMFDLGLFCTFVTLDSPTATVGGLSFRSRSLMWFRGRVSVKLLKTGRVRIDYLDHSQRLVSGGATVLTTARTHPAGGSTDRYIQAALSTREGVVRVVNMWRGRGTFTHAHSGGDSHRSSFPARLSSSPIIT